MDDWEIGDLALCIKGGKLTRAGCLYTVSDVKQPGEQRRARINPFAAPLLRFVGFPYASLPPGAWSGAERFVKVTPQDEDEEDRETLRLMREKEHS